MSKIKIKNIELITTFIFVLFCLALYIYFPASGYFQYKAVALVFLVLLPYLFSRFILKEESFFEKIIIGEWKKNLILMLIGLLISFLIAISLFKFTDLLNTYPLSQSVRNNFWEFISYELLGVSFTVAVYEIFFRGFLMFYLEKFFGLWSILIQFLIFFAMILLLGIPFSYYFLYILFIPIAGIIAYKSKSILYSFMGQLIFIIIVDATAIVLMK